MKKIVLVLLFCTIFLMGCQTKKETFYQDGVSVTLSSDFKKYDVENWDYYLENDSIAFMSKRVNKASKISGIEFSKLKLADYMALMLKTNKLDATVYSVEGIHGNFQYCFYTTNVDGVKQYGYMFLVMESKDYFYNINFSCDYDIYKESKELFLQYAITLRVE